MIEYTKPANPAIIEDRETYLDKYKLKKKTTIIIKNIKGSCPKRIPADVATAFPPLKPANIGYIWPITATTPKISGLTFTWMSVKRLSNNGRQVANVPFKMSENVTTNPAFFPKTLNEFVPPRFPLPCSLISIL